MQNLRIIMIIFLCFCFYSLSVLYSTSASAGTDGPHLPPELASRFAALLNTAQQAGLFAVCLAQLNPNNKAQGLVVGNRAYKAIPDAATESGKFEVLIFGTTGRSLEALHDLVKNAGCLGSYRDDVLYQFRKDIDHPLFIQLR